MYRGWETDHQSGKVISAWSGTCVLRDQGCRSGWHLHVSGNREMEQDSLGLTMEVGVAYS